MQLDYDNAKVKAGLISQLMDTIANQRCRLQSFEKQVHHLDQERSALVLRLSKTEGDENQPPKLAEKFSELYDDEWTDAFEEVLNEPEEQEGVQFLLRLLQRAYSPCTQMSKDHIETTKTIATTNKYAASNRMQDDREENTTQAAGGDGNVQSETSKDNSDQDRDSGRKFTGRHRPKTTQRPKYQELDASTLHCSLTAGVLIELLETRKFIDRQMEEYVIEKVTNVIAAEFDITLKTGVMTCTYIRKCVQLCWFMSLKDPHIYMDIITPDDDTKFDTDVYKAYTKTGDRLLYVVRPPLYLHEGGPMLSKGVAQGTRK